jgi:amidase
MRRLVVCLLAAVCATATPARAQIPKDTDCLRSLRGVDLYTATIPDLQRALDRGRFMSVDLVRAYEARIEAYSKYNAIRQLNPAAEATAAQLDAERRHGHVRGPLHGIPVLLKDNVGTDDMPTTAGSIALEGQIPKRDAFITKRLRQAGAIILGKTNLSEFANWMATGMPNGFSSLGGQVVNAYSGGDPSGSSSGSGVASSLALAAATIGTETSGSILSPSLENSDVGLKTTRGMASRTGIVPLAESFDVPGPIVRHVVDAAVMLGAMAGTDPEDPATAEADKHVTDFAARVSSSGLEGVRLAYSDDDASGLDAEHQALWDQTKQQLTALGAKLVPSSGFGDADLSGTVFELPAIYSEFHYDLDHYLQTEQRDGARVHSLAEIIAYNQQHSDRIPYGQDKLITSEAAPGVKEVGEGQSEPAIARAHGAIDSTLDAANAVAFIAPDGPHIGIGAAGGHPTVTIPLGYPDSQRMGITFLGRRFSEADLLAAAGALETRTHDQWMPPTQVGVAQPESCDAAGKAPFLVPTTRVTRLRVRGTRARIAVAHGPIFRVRVTARDRHGRLVLRGRAARIASRGRVRLHRVRPGRPLHAYLVARDPSNRSVSAFARLRR